MIVWNNINDDKPDAGVRVMLLSSKLPSGYPVFAVLRNYKGRSFWKLMPSKMNTDFQFYDLWAYINQPVLEKPTAKPAQY